MIKSYRDLKVWQLAIEVVVHVYETAKQFPPHELYGLRSQMQRAAVSIPANISEGHSRDSTKEFLRFISIAQGSCAELETHLIVAERLQYIQKQSLNSLLNELDEFGKMLRGLQKSLETKLPIAKS
jgi:four helix bundle protein